jgi:hypothetical protein
MEGVGDSIRMATVAEHMHMSGGFPAKHSTQPVRSTTRSDITPISARNLWPRRPDKR